MVTDSLLDQILDKLFGALVLIRPHPVFGWLKSVSAKNPAKSVPSPLIFDRLSVPLPRILSSQFSKTPPYA